MEAFQIVKYQYLHFNYPRRSQPGPVSRPVWVSVCENVPQAAPVGRGGGGGKTVQIQKHSSSEQPSALQEKKFQYNKHLEDFRFLTLFLQLLMF